MTSSRGARFARTLFFAGACLIGFVAIAERASAETSASDLESARELYKQGKELRAAGDIKGALEKFKAGHALGQTPVTGLELGRAHMDLAQLLEAREVFLSIARLPVQSDEGEKSAGARTEAAQLADQLRPRIPTLTVKILGAPAGSPPVVTVDGVTIPVAAIGAPRKLNPGSHEVTAKSTSTLEQRATVELKEGESRELPLTLNVTAETLTAKPPAADPGNPSDAGGTKTNALVYVGFGVGVVGVATGSITGLMALSRASKVDAACGGKLICPPSAKSDVTAGRTLGTVSTIAFIVGGAGVALGVYGLLNPAKSSPPRAGLVVHPEIGAGWAGLTGSF
jgi:hypothetical protein